MKNIVSEETVDGKYKVITYDDGTCVREYWPGPGMREKLDNTFTYHAPNPDQPPRYVALREKAKEFAEMIVKYCPSGQDRDEAMQHLKLTIMCANMSIAIGEKTKL